MQYSNTLRGRFICRPNRFIAEVDVNGERVICHVKNTGRCREILTEGASVILQRSSDKKRKTEYDLIAVYKGDKLINIDSQAPNRVFDEWLRSGGLTDGVTVIRPEAKYGDSRLDFYLEANGKGIYAEVKGVTLEENGIAMFPDAPTERGLKHVNELIRASGEGYGAYIVFIIQMNVCRYFVPNKATDPKLSEALRTAFRAGVKIVCLTCDVTEDSIRISDEPYVSFIL